MPKIVPISFGALGWKSHFCPKKESSGSNSFIHSHLHSLWFFIHSHLHSLWFLKSPKLLNVEHQVTTIYEFHHKVKTILKEKMYKYSVNKNWQMTDDQYHHKLVDQSGQWPENYNIYWRFTIHLTLMMTSTQVVETPVSITTNKPSRDYTHPHDHTPPTYDNYDLWFQTIYINVELASKK